VKKAVLLRLIEASGNTNLSETMWLRAEASGVDEALSAAMTDSYGNPNT